MAGFTRKAIRDAFLKLLNDRPFGQITVKDIVDECGVNRNTFYYYYEGIPQLMESIVREEAEKIIREHPTVDSLEECLNVALEFALTHRKAALHIYHSVSRDIYEQYQWRTCGHLAEVFVDRLLGERRITPEDRATVVDYIKCVNFGITIGWLESGMNPAAMARFHRIIQLKSGDLERMLDRCTRI